MVNLSPEAYNKLLQGLIEIKRTQQAISIFTNLLTEDFQSVKSLEEGLINKILLSACYLGKSEEALDALVVLLNDTDTSSILSSLIFETLLVNISNDLKKDRKGQEYVNTSSSKISTSTVQMLLKKRLALHPSSPAKSNYLLLLVKTLIEIDQFSIGSKFVLHLYNNGNNIIDDPTTDVQIAVALMKFCAKNEDWQKSLLISNTIANFFKQNPDVKGTDYIKFYIGNAEYTSFLIETLYEIHLGSNSEAKKSSKQGLIKESTSILNLYTSFEKVLEFKGKSKRLSERKVDGDDNLPSEEKEEKRNHPRYFLSEKALHSLLITFLDMSKLCNQEETDSDKKQSKENIDYFQAAYNLVIEKEYTKIGAERVIKNNISDRIFNRLTEACIEREDFEKLEDIVMTMIFSKLSPPPEVIQHLASYYMSKGIIQKTKEVDLARQLFHFLQKLPNLSRYRIILLKACLSSSATKTLSGKKELAVAKEYLRLTSDLWKADELEDVKNELLKDKLLSKSLNDIFNTFLLETEE